MKPSDRPPSTTATNAAPACRRSKAATPTPVRLRPGRLLRRRRTYTVRVSRVTNPNTTATPLQLHTPQLLTRTEGPALTVYVQQSASLHRRRLGVTNHLHVRRGLRLTCK